MAFLSVKFVIEACDLALYLQVVEGVCDFAFSFLNKWMVMFFSLVF